TLLGPLRPSRSAQLRAGGYAITSFTINFGREQATCPRGAVSSSWAPFTRGDGVQLIKVQFPAPACRACPARGNCTTAVRTRPAMHRYTGWAAGRLCDRGAWLAGWLGRLIMGE